jgi:hypothetical protein
MKTKKIMSLTLALSIVLLWMPKPVASLDSDRTQPSLDKLVNESYLQVLDAAPELKFSDAQMEEFKKKLEKDKEAEKEKLKAKEQAINTEVKQIKTELDQMNKASSRDTPDMAQHRQDLHCQLLKLQKRVAKTKVQRENGLDVLYDNKLAKLQLLKEWPPAKAEIEQTIASGKARQRPHGDVEDIGFRDVGKDQEKDIKRGEEAVKELQRYGLLPPEVQDEAVNTYVRNLAQVIGRNSDVKVPLKVKVLRTEEINAFALPGGFLYVNTGLIEKADNESELAGVMAHEIAHVAARHSARLMTRATIASIIYQAAQVAALIFTGGVASIGIYYALQYGFYGLGLVLSLTLLGVSREYEAEADQLGAQYLWKAGYDPRGFVSFFDKMASEKGYVRSLSFFRTHPAFYDRIITTFREISFLPPKEDYITDSKEFHQIKDRLKKVIEEEKKKDPEAPTLKKDQNCPKDQDEEAPGKESEPRDVP